MASYSARRASNTIWMALCWFATIVGLFFLFAILITLLYKGFTALSLQMFIESTPPPGEDGGLINAIFGSVAMTVIAVVVATPIGILAGTYLAEYSRGHWLGEAAKFINDILLSAPSIIIGLFVYELLVVRMGHFSAIAGAVALAIIAIPVTVRTTEDMLNLVPQGMKDASTALGAYPWRTIMSVIYPAARSGVVTGLLLAIARISGETAPLLFTALNNQFWSSNLLAPMANLPVVIFQFALSPYPNWQKLAWAGALIITASILLLNVIARVAVSRLNPAGRRG